MGVGGGLEYLGRGLRDSSPAGHSLHLLYLDLLAGLLSVLLAIPLVLLVDIQDQLLNAIASQLVFIIVP